MVLTSSEARLFSSVVFPALSKPSSTILTSCSVVPFSFSMTESKPCMEVKGRAVELTVDRPYSFLAYVHYAILN